MLLLAKQPLAYKPLAYKSFAFVRRALHSFAVQGYVFVRKSTGYFSEAKVSLATSRCHFVTSWICKQQHVGPSGTKGGFLFGD